MKTIAAVILLAVWASAVAYTQTNDEQNMFRLAQSFEQTGDAEHAGQLYEQLQAAHPDNYVYFEALRRNLTQRKKYDAAISLCIRRLALLPNDVNVMASLGGLYQMAVRPVQADSVWDAMIAGAPRNPGVVRLVAAEQIQLRLLEKAAATYLRGRKISGDAYAFSNELASLYTGMMNYRGASEEYLRMLEQNEFQLDYVESRLSTFTDRPDGLAAALAAAQDYARDPKRSIVFLRVQTWLWMEAKRYDEAFLCAEKIEKRINSNGTELFVFAERVFRENAFAPAAQAYSRSIENGAGQSFVPLARLGYARCLEELNAAGDSASGADSEREAERAVRLGTVLGSYETLAREYPRTEIHAQSLYRIGTLRASRLNDLDGALRAFDSVTVIAPASPMLSVVRSAMGEVYLRQGKLDEAWKQYAVVGASPQSAVQQRSDARFRMAEVLYFKADFDSALSVLEGLTSNYAADEANDALELRAFILENKEENLEALRAFAEADFLVRRRKLSEAVGAYASIVVSYTSAPLADDAMIRKAAAEVVLHRPADALHTLEALLAQFPKSTERDRAQFRIGEIYDRQLHDTVNAIKAYGEVLSAYPNSLFTEEARKRVRTLRGDAL